VLLGWSPIIRNRCGAPPAATGCLPRQARLAAADQAEPVAELPQQEPLAIGDSTSFRRHMLARSPLAMAQRSAETSASALAQQFRASLPDRGPRSRSRSTASTSP
jgi:hypothetical protein